MGYYSAFIAAAAAYEGDQMSARSAADTNAQSVAIAQMNNQFNSAEAQKNREFQSSMADTQMERRVADLKGAGLNPALAYTQGGAAAPSGSMASANPNPSLINPGQSYAGLGTQISSALDLQTKGAQADLMKAQAAKLNAESGTEIPANVERIRADTALTTTQASQVANTVKMMNLQLANFSGPDSRSVYERNIDNDAAQNALKTQILSVDAQTQQAIYQSAIKARIDLNYAESIGAVNLYNASSGVFGRFMAYLNLGKPIVSTAAQAAGAASEFMP